MSDDGWVKLRTSGGDGFGWFTRSESFFSFFCIFKTCVISMNYFSLFFWCCRWTVLFKSSRRTVKTAEVRTSDRIDDHSDFRRVHFLFSFLAHYRSPRLFIINANFSKEGKIQSPILFPFVDLTRDVENISYKHLAWWCNIVIFSIFLI